MVLKACNYRDMDADESSGCILARSRVIGVIGVLRVVRVKHYDRISD